MDKDTIEALRKMQELNYRQLDSSAVVVAEMGEVDYSTDTNKFGVGPLQCGEFLVFVKKK